MTCHCMCMLIQSETMPCFKAVSRKVSHVCRFVFANSVKVRGGKLCRFKLLFRCHLSSFPLSTQVYKMHFVSGLRATLIKHSTLTRTLYTHANVISKCRCAPPAKLKSRYGHSFPYKAHTRYSGDLS